MNWDDPTLGSTGPTGGVGPTGSAGPTGPTGTFSGTLYQIGVTGAGGQYINTNPAAPSAYGSPVVISQSSIQESRGSTTGYTYEVSYESLSTLTTGNTLGVPILPVGTVFPSGVYAINFSCIVAARRDSSLTDYGCWNASGLILLDGIGGYTDQSSIQKSNVYKSAPSTLSFGPPLIVSPGQTSWAMEVGNTTGHTYNVSYKMTANIIY